MRVLSAVLLFAACRSNDDDTGDDGGDDGPGDTDTSDTDDSNPDTDDTDADTDTDEPEEDFCSFTQCGGDVVGTWNLIGSCIDLPAYTPCPTSTTDIDIDTQGEWTFDAAGTYAINATAAYTIVQTFPAECNGAFTDCSEYDPGDLPATECTGDVAVLCTCTTTQPAFPFVDSGTWTYVNEDVRLESTYMPVGEGGGDLPTQYQVCRDGARLDLDLRGPFTLRYTMEQ